MHALRRDVFYAHEGAVRRRHLQAQTEQAWCLTIATNAITTWTAEYLGMAVDQLRGRGRRVDEELLAHISPAHSDNIGLFGTITVDVDHETRPPRPGRPVPGVPSPAAPRRLRALRCWTLPVTAAARFGQADPGQHLPVDLHHLLAGASRAAFRPAPKLPVPSIAQLPATRSRPACRLPGGHQHTARVHRHGAFRPPRQARFEPDG